MTNTDKEFLISFENGEPDWSKCCAGDLSNYPSVKWKLQNIDKLVKSNPKKHQEGVQKLQNFFKDTRLNLYWYLFIKAYLTRTLSLISLIFVSCIVALCFM